MKNIFYGIWILLVAFHFSSCGRGDDDTLIHLHKDEYTSADQNKIGYEIQNYIENTPSLFPMMDRAANAKEYNYVMTILNTLVNTTSINTRDTFAWEVNVIQDDEIRSAFAAPGGKIFIYTGLLKFISGENELLGILAHEIYYSDSGLAMKYLQSKYSKTELILGDILLGKDVDGMDQLCLFLKDLAYTEDEVIEADNFAMNVICPFQYNALGIKTIIDEANQSSSAVMWLDVRPSAANRIDNIVEKAELCGDEEDPTFSERYEAFKDQLPK